jgi:hypothetical protein
LYPKTRLMYFRVTQRIQRSISVLRNNLLIHLRSPLLSRLMFSNLTLYADSVERTILTCRYSWRTHNPTADMTPYHVYPLRIPFAQCSLPHSKHIFFLPDFESVTTSTQCVIFQTLNF